MPAAINAHCTVYISRLDQTTHYATSGVVALASLELSGNYGCTIALYTARVYSGVPLIELYSFKCRIFVSNNCASNLSFVQFR